MSQEPREPVEHRLMPGDRSRASAPKGPEDRDARFEGIRNSFAVVTRMSVRQRATRLEGLKLSCSFGLSK